MAPPYPNTNAEFKVALKLDSHRATSSGLCVSMSHIDSGCCKAIIKGSSSSCLAGRNAG